MVPTSWFILSASKNFRHPNWGACVYLAATAAIVVAAAVVVCVAAVVTGAQTVAAAAAEQQNQDDDPPAVISTKTITAHKEYLLDDIRDRSHLSRFAAHSKIFLTPKSVQKKTN